MGYSKQDVQTHYERGSHGNPAVNIKCHLWENGDLRGASFPTSLLREVADEHGHDADAFVSWWRTMVEEEEDRFYEMIWRAGGWACESGFEYARELASEVFDRKVDVWQEGRSGGWMAVHGLPSIEEWDAIALGRWRRFERYVRSMVEDHPRQVASLVAMNDYESHLAGLAAEAYERDTGRWVRLFDGSPLAGMMEVA